MGNNSELVTKVKNIAASYPNLNAIERIYADFGIKDTESLLMLYFDESASRDVMNKAIREFGYLYNSSMDNPKEKFTCVSASHDTLIKSIADYVMERGADF